MLLFAVPAALAVLICAGALSLRSRVRNKESATSTVVVAGKSVGLPTALWAIASSGCAERVGEYLLEARAKSAQGLAEGVTNLVDSLPENERAAIVEHTERMERTRAERTLWDVQAETITGAATAGTLDALLLTLGQNSEWLGEVVSAATAHIDPSHVIVESLVHHTVHGAAFAMPDATASVVDHLDHAVGPAIDHAGNALADGALHGLSAIADAHIPVFTIGRAIYRAKTAADAGLEASRVQENLALDAGVTGGAVAAGAAIGTMIFPGVGTVIGGFVGGLFGRGVASAAKERHLVAAQQLAHQRLFELGNSVPSSKWIGVSEDMAACVRAGERSLTLMKAISKRGRKPLRWSRVGRLALLAAIRTGSADLQVQAAELQAWQQELQQTTGNDGAVFRGSVLTIRPDLAKRFGTPKSRVDAVLSAQDLVQEERRKLQLA